MSRSAGQPCAGPMMWMAGEQLESRCAGRGRVSLSDLRPSLLPVGM